MYVFEPGPDRWKLGFREAVLENFKFLRKYGFRLVRADVTFVRYETPWYSFKRRLYVNVYHSRGGYELGFETGPCDNDREMVNLPWILKWAGYPEADKYSGEKAVLCTHTREGVQVLVPRMAELARKYAEPFLRRDRQAYASLNRLIDEANAAWEEEMRRNAPKRHQATLAWEARDFGRVASIYGSFETELMPEERERLAEARRELAARVPTHPKSEG